MFFLSHCATMFFHFDGMHIYPVKVSSRDPFSTVLHGMASVFQGPFFYGMVHVACITYTERIERVDCAYMSACRLCHACRVYLVWLVLIWARVARQTIFFLFPILIIPVLDMESPQRDPRPPTLPTTIQACPEATSEEPAYNLLILRRDDIKISPELRCMHHSTISRHHPSMLVPTSCWNRHPGRPYLAILGITLGPITNHRAEQYFTT